MSAKTGPKIVVVDDSAITRDYLAEQIEKEAFSCVAAADYDAGFEAVFAHNPAAVILDVFLRDPWGRDGILLCQKLRESGLRMPVIFFTVVDAANHPDTFFKSRTIAGGDDLWTKSAALASAEGGAPESGQMAETDRVADPRIRSSLTALQSIERQQKIPESSLFPLPKADAQELIARIRVALYRAEPPPFSDDALRIQVANSKARVWRVPADAEIVLTPIESSLLAALVRDRGQPLSKAELKRQAGIEGDRWEHNVEAHISRLRQKIEPNPKRPRYLRADWAQGYQFKA